MKKLTSAQIHALSKQIREDANFMLELQQSTASIEDKLEMYKKRFPLATTITADMLQNQLGSNQSTTPSRIKK